MTQTMPSRPSGGATLVLATIALAAVLLGIYQWIALTELRLNHEAPICDLGANLDCGAVWNSPLADTIHQYTGMPFAAWGVAWGLVMFVLALEIRIRGRHHAAPNDAILALRLTSVVGGLISIALLVYSVMLGMYCITCIIFYVLVIGALMLSFRGIALPHKPWPAAVMHGGGMLLVVLALLLYPGLQTPKQALTAASLGDVADEGTGEDTLATFLTSLDPQLQQVISNARAIYLDAPLLEQAKETGRFVHGTARARLHLVDWVDIRCPHCKNLELALNEIRNLTPAGSWSEEARHFPLDKECNPHIPRGDGTGVACLAARALICLGGSPRGMQVREELFANQRKLTSERIWEIAAPTSTQRHDLEGCVNSPETEVALQGDIEFAVKHGIEGTPMVVVNGRQIPPLPPLLYALIIAGGNPNAKGFSVLPPPRAELP